MKGASNARSVEDSPSSLTPRFAFVVATSRNITSSCSVFACPCQLCEKALTDVYMIRRMKLDPDCDAPVSSRRLAEQDEEDQNEVTVAFCLECFDRTE